MKLNPLLSAGLFAAVTMLSFGAQAAADADKPVEAKAPASDAKPEKKVVAKKKVAPHSHMQEKTGIPQKAVDADAEKASPAKDTSKHSHPRDAK